MTTIIARDVTVEFPVYNSSSKSLKHRLINATTGGRLCKDAAKHVSVKALDNINFEFKEGDRIGLAGHNGAGKSTMLRLLAGVYEPTSGYYKSHGRILSLLDIYLGMDVEANAWDNIFLRGLLLGFKPKEIRAQMDDIAEFSELGEYLDMPIRTYSSGMSMRLAFAISTCVQADILLMDEWLSVGDAAFVEKAENRMKEVVKNTSILVIASHSRKLFEDSCNKVLHLEHGKIVRDERL